MTRCPLCSSRLRAIGWAVAFWSSLLTLACGGDKGASPEGDTLDPRMALLPSSLASLEMCRSRA